MAARALSRGFAVEIERLTPSDAQDSPWYRGRLVAKIPSLAAPPREIEGQGCAEVLQALSLVAALSAERLATEPVVVSSAPAATAVARSPEMDEANKRARKPS
jgi:hypothetical protein